MVEGKPWIYYMGDEEERTHTHTRLFSHSVCVCVSLCCEAVQTTSFIQENQPARFTSSYSSERSSSLCVCKGRERWMSEEEEEEERK